MKLSQRFSTESLSKDGAEDSRGRLFFDPVNGWTDLSLVQIVGCSVDTIRQLFYGVPDEGLIDKLESHAKSREDLIFLGAEGPGAIRWHFTKMGKVARYRYKLQNNDEGIVILFGSYFEKLDSPGQHLKIELSPHFISQRSKIKIWQRLHGDYGLSRAFLHDPMPRGCAVHLAADYQGFTVEKDFVTHLSTYSRTVRTFDSISELDLSSFSDSVASYGGSNTEKNYLIGRASSFQVCMYDKTKEMVKRDKQDYFQREWLAYSFGSYDPAKKVRRIELRFHHSVIREIGQGMDKSLESWFDVVDHLTDIWRYGMRLTRYNMTSCRGSVVHPFWQLLMQDVEFYVPADGLQICRKKKESVDPIAKNISLLIGNMITLCARSGMNTKQVMGQLKRLTFYPQIVSYYISRGLSESDLRENVEKGLALRRIIGKAA
ncbi:hypothetical protein [Methylomonas methanica]|uniref:Replication initiation factor n=1 Tax=Methylomonas methanica (strain DSM 25384 / MC09) TaxID=857087 RepID=G0A210_METMM|nr:hypothetical protein [Methylomonas methanica]AEG02553.1 hypothetical protein Metme_4202 [Methylomonas methanica MC09]